MSHNRAHVVSSVIGCVFAASLASAPAASACGSILSAMTFSGTTLKWGGSDTCAHATHDQYIQLQLSNGTWRTVTTRTWKSTAVSFSMVHTVCLTGLGNYRSKGTWAGKPFTGTPVAIRRYPTACL